MLNQAMTMCSAVGARCGDRHRLTLVFHLIYARCCLRIGEPRGVGAHIRDFLHDLRLLSHSRFLLQLLFGLRLLHLRLDSDGLRISVPNWQLILLVRLVDFAVLVLLFVVEFVDIDKFVAVGDELVLEGAFEVSLFAVEHGR